MMNEAEATVGLMLKTRLENVKMVEVKENREERQKLTEEVKGKHHSAKARVLEGQVR